MNAEQIKEYEVEPSIFWHNTWMHGDGYNTMGMAEKRGWNALSGWGHDGWDIGSWPYVIVFHQDEDKGFDVVSYCEGDVTLYHCPDKQTRDAITDYIAFFHWKCKEEEWVKDYETVDECPRELLGPFTWNEPEPESLKHVLVIHPNPF